MLSASSSFRHLRYAGLCTCRYSFSTMFQRNPAGQKMHVIEWGVCRWQTVLYTWLNLNRRLNLCSARTDILERAQHTWEDYPATLQTQLSIQLTGSSRVYRSLPDFNVLIHVLNSTKIVAVAPWRSKTVLVEKGRAPIFNFLLVRNSGDGSWIFIWYPVYTPVWKYPEWIFRAWFSFYPHVPIWSLIKDHLVSRWYHD